MVFLILVSVVWTFSVTIESSFLTEVFAVFLVLVTFSDCFLLVFFLSVVILLLLNLYSHGSGNTNDDAFSGFYIGSV